MLKWPQVTETSGKPLFFSSRPTFPLLWTLISTSYKCAISVSSKKKKETKSNRKCIICVLLLHINITGHISPAKPALELIQFDTQVQTGETHFTHFTLYSATFILHEYFFVHISALFFFFLQNFSDVTKLIPAIILYNNEQKNKNKN